MDFTVEYILNFNQLLIEKNENKQWLQYQLNRNVIKLLNKKKEI